MNWTMTQIAFVVLCAMGSGLGFAAIGFPPILGYIITGIVLGPSGFEFITDRSVVAIFSEMGIQFLLFTIGLSLSFDKIKHIWRKSIISTLLSVLFIYVFTYIVGSIFNFSKIYILLIAFCVSLSSTALTVKSLKRFKEADSDIEVNTYGILIAQDLLALGMVIVINCIGDSHVNEHKTARFMVVLVMSAALLWYFVKYAHHVHKFTNFIKKHDDMLTLVVFGICLGSGVFAEIAGLSAPFGAFIAGLLLGNSNIKNEIKNISTPIQEILLMTFFLSVGLLVDFNFIWEHIFAILSFLLFITVGKTIINIFVLRLCKFSLKESVVIGILLGHVGEFSFMLLYAANKEHLISEVVVKFLVSITALSLFVTPFWLIFADRCRRLTTHTAIISSREILRIALEKESNKIHQIFVYIVTVISQFLTKCFAKGTLIFELFKKKPKK